MKIEGLDHPKTLDLAARLEIELPTAIGHLELLWAFTGKKAPQGNIGKWPDGAIARACHWMGKPEIFINALQHARLVDGDDAHRLTVHDWHEHAPGWVRAKLKKVGLKFVGGADPSLVPSSEDTPDGSSEGTEGDPEKPLVKPLVSLLSKCSEVKGSEVKSPRGRKRPIPDDFLLTPERQQYAEKHLPQVDAAALLETFRSTSKAKGWEYVDWDQHWQTLVRQWAPNSSHWSSGQYPRKPGSVGINGRKDPYANAI
jgi:hypothetical protein